MATRKKIKKRPSGNSKKHSLSAKSVGHKSSRSTLPKTKSKQHNIIKAKQALVALMFEECNYWLSRKDKAYYEINPDAWRFFNAMGFVSFSAEADIKAISVQFINIEEFYFKVLEITNKANWGEGENWASDVRRRALNSVKEIIIQNIPKAMIEKYQQKITGRGNIRVFLSYSSKDREIVEKFGSYLSRQGLHIWYDKHEVYIGDEIHSKISEGIDRSQYFCIFLSRNSVGSKWVQDELRQAIERVHRFETKVFPILLEDCEMPGYLRGINYGDLRNQNEVSINGIAERVVEAIDKYMN